MPIKNSSTENWLKNNTRKAGWAIFIALLSACAQPVDQPSMLPEGVEGVWVTKEPVEFYEQWDRVEDGWAGTGFIIEKGDTQLTEQIRIFEQEGKLIYEADVAHNDRPIQFTSTILSGDSLVFTNPEHDFPTHIVYRKTEDDHLFVKVSGDDRKLVFDFSRVH